MLCSLQEMTATLLPILMAQWDFKNVLSMMNKRMMLTSNLENRFSCCQSLKVIGLYVSIFLDWVGRFIFWPLFPPLPEKHLFMECLVQERFPCQNWKCPSFTNSVFPSIASSNCLKVRKNIDISIIVKTLLHSTLRQWFTYMLPQQQLNRNLIRVESSKQFLWQIVTRHIEVLSIQ